MFKQKIGYLVILVLLLSTITMSSAKDTQQDKAVALNKINVLIGDGVNFNLNGQLKRSEAATFIVRLLGVENEVLRNANKYKKTEFKDIEIDAWYAAYVGYVSKNNIVGGFGDGTYRPNSYVTEKQFIKMVLGALGYNQGVDFEWSKVYSFAYEKGLFKNEEYERKTQDNKQYKRGEVVELLYTSLTTNLKSKDITVIERLVNEKFTSEDIAIKYGFIKKDTVPMAIDSITSKNKTTLEIKLNEPATLTAGYNVVIYDKENANNTLAVRNITIEENIVTVVTLEQNRSISYAVELSGFKDLEGNINKAVGYINGTGSEGKNTADKEDESAVKSNYFKIASVEVVNKQELNVFFTHPVTEAVEIPFSYILKADGKEVVVGNYSTMEVKTKYSQNNAVGIFLRNYSLKDNVKYSLEILGSINSKYKVPLNGGRGDTYNFIAPSNIASTTSEIKLITAEPVGENYIKIVFSTEVDKDSALANVNYVLRDITTGIQINSALEVSFFEKSENRYKEVLVRFANMVKDHTYEITVKNVKDSYKQSSIKEHTMAFYGYPTIESELAIEFVYAFNDHMVKVYFTEPVTEKILDSLFIIDGRAIVKKTFDPKDNKSAILYLTKSTPVMEGNTYTLRLSNVKDSLNKVIPKVFTYNFAGTAISATNIEISSAKYISENKVLVTYDRGVDIVTNPVSKYRIQYKENNATRIIIPISVEYVSDNEAVLTLAGTTTGVEEILYCTSIVDFSGQTTSSISTGITK